MAYGDDYREEPMTVLQLEAGVSIADISPRAGVQLVGYPYATRENTGIHDPLYAACLIIDNGECEAMLVASDLVFFEKAFVARFREKAASATGVPAGHIMMTGSHTHSGPRIATRLPEEETAQGWKIEWEYLAELEEKLLDLASAASRNMQQARIGFGVGRAGKEKGIGGNRHHPAGPCDPAVGVMALQDRSGEWFAVWTKYSLHPTILQVENTLVSADYPGAIRQFLAAKRPEALFMFCQGATGDQSSRYFRRSQTHEEVTRFGHTIGAEVDRVLDSLELADRCQLQVLSSEVMPDWRNLPSIRELEARIATHWKELKELEAAGAPYAQRQTSYLNRLGEELALMYARLHAEGRKHPWELEVPFEIQAIRIGDACILGLPGEVFVDYTLAIERQSPLRPTFVVTLANGGTPGYVVTKEAAKKKLFEAGVSMMEPSTGDRLVEAAAELCRKLR
jgi:hypothetical protein